MQLKNLGESLNAVNNMQNVLSGAFVSTFQQNQTLGAALVQYSEAALKAAVVQEGLNREQIKAILTAKGYQGQLLATTAEEWANAASTNAATVAQAGMTASTSSLTYALQGLKVAILSNPLFIAAGAGLAIWGIVKAVDYFTVSVEEAADAARESAEELKDVQSEIDSINSELTEAEQRIDELNGKENLSLIEQDELNKLRQTNDELERELKVKERLAAISQEQASEDAKAYFNKSENYSYDNGSEFIAVQGNVIDAAMLKLEHYQYLQEKISETQEKMDAIILKNPKDYVKDSTYQSLKNTYDGFIYQSGELEKEISDTITTFMELDDALTGTDAESKQLLDSISKYYVEFDKTFKGIGQTTESKIDEVFARPTFEKAKEVLISLGKEGTLSVDVLNSRFSDLSQALENAGINAQDLYQYIMALADPDAVNINNVKKSLYDQFVGANEGTDPTDFDRITQEFDDWIASKSDEEIEIIYEINKSNDTSSWSLEDFDKKIESIQNEKINISNINDLENHLEDLSKKYKQVADLPEGKDLLKPLGDAAKKYVDAISTPTDFSDAFSSLPLEKVEKYVDLVKSGKIDKDTISSYNELSDIITRTGMSAEDAANELKEFADSYSSSADLTSNIQDAYSLFEEIQKEVSETQKISVESLNSIASQFPKLTNATAQYAQGLLSTAEIMELLEQAYYDDADAFQAAMVAKLSGNEEFFTTILSNNQSLFDALSAAYGDDVQNWKSLAQAKAAIDSSLITQLAAMWSKYYGSMAGFSLKRGKDGQYTLNNDDPTAIYESGYQEMENQVAAVNKMIRAMNEAAKTEIKIPDTWDLPKSYSKNGSSKDKTTKDDTEKFDLIKQKIDELRDSYSKLQSEANNSDNTYANQLNFLNAAISKQEELIQLERTALDVYKNDWIQAASVLPENLQDLIMHGSSDPETAIQSLSGTLKEQFETAQKSWNTYKELMDQVGEDEKELDQNQKSRYQKQIEKDKSEIEKLKEKSSIEQDSYESNLDFLNQAVAKSEELSKKLQERAEEAKQEWEEAKAVIESIGSSGDIAKIMNGELNLSDFEDNPDYYAALERGIKAHEDLTDTEEELEENEISLEELRKQAFEKGMQYLKSQQDLIKNTNSTTQTAIELIEALGGEATADMYQDMIDNSQEEIDLLEEQIDMLDERISQVDEESAEYYELKGQIEEANQAILQCKINQQEWNEAIMDLPIRKLERYQAILKNIKQDLQNWLNQQSALTNPTTQSQYQSLIDISSKQIKKGLEEIAQLQKKLAQYEPNSDKYKETAQQIQDIKDEIANAIQNQIEWNEAIKQIPINNINRLKTNQDNVKQDLQNWISEQQALGNQISADQYQKLFDIGNTQIATRLEKIALLTKNLATYDPNSEKYQETLEEIQTTKNEISSIVQEQIEWNEAIKQIPIDNIDKLLTGYENVAQALENWKAEQEALGNDISAEQYQKQIDLAATQIEGKQEKLALLQEKLATYEPNSEKYLETLQAIEDTKNEISSLVQNQAEWNEAIRNIPITNIERLQSGYQNVRSSLEEWIATQESLGYTTGEDQYQSLIDMASTQIESNVEKLRLLQEKLDTYEPNSTGYNETLQAIADTKSEINSLVQNQIEWNEAIKQIPLNNIAKLQEGYSNIQTKLEDWISKQDALNHVIDADAYQKLIDLGSDQISSHIEEIELLKKNLATYEPGTTQYDETLKAIDEAENKISSIIQEQAEWNEALKQLPINNVERLQKGLTNLQSKLEAWNNQQTALGNVIGAKQYQTLIDVSGVQIDALNEKISILKQNLETYEPNSAKYDETLQSIQGAENEIVSIVQSQIEWNEQLKQIPIDRIDVLQDKYSNLRQDLQNWIDEQGALGKIIGRDQYQSLFDFSQVQLDTYMKKLDLLQEKLKTYEEGSDKYNETAQAIQDVKNEISSVIQEQAEWNAEILNMPLDHLNKYTEQLQLALDSLQGVQDEMNTAISAVTETIDRETDAINEQKEAIEDEKESTEDAYQAKIDAIQEIIDGLKDAREEEDLLLKIEKARAAWQKAQEQKTKKVRNCLLSQ